MNTKDNRRSRNTDERIIRAFYEILQKKGTVAKVTVREICEKAEINRSTFYAHYQDAYDVLEKVEKHMAKSLTAAFLQKLDEGGDIGECFIEMFKFIKEYRQFYAVYFNESHTSGVIGLAREAYADRIRNLSWREVGFSSPEELAYQEDFYIAGMSAMIRRWINGGCRETPERMCEMLSHQYSIPRSMFQWDD